MWHLRTNTFIICTAQVYRKFAHHLTMLHHSVVYACYNCWYVQTTLPQSVVGFFALFVCGVVLMSKLTFRIYGLFLPSTYGTPECLVHIFVDVHTNVHSLSLCFLFYFCVCQ
jgi:hypothetical protein